MRLDDRLKELSIQWSVSALINPINLRDMEEDTWLRTWKPQYTNIEFERLIDAYEDVVCHFDEYEFDRKLRDAYISKIRESLKYLYAFKDRDAVKITELHGTTDTILVSKHHDELLQISDQVINYSTPEPMCTSDYAKGYLQACIDTMEVPYIVEQRDIIARCAVAHKSQKVYVKQDTMYTHGEIKRLQLHELDVHVARAIAGKDAGGLFEIGFDNYIELEEGLAVYNEVSTGLKEGLVRTYVRMLACNMCDNTFEDMVKKLIEQFPRLENLVYDTCFRIKRGLKDFNDYGGYTKDRLYLSGYLKVCDLLKEHPEINFKQLIESGKTNFEYWLK